VEFTEQSWLVAWLALLSGIGLMVMSEYKKNEQVKTDCCGKWRRLKTGPIGLFGKEVWYPYENDTPEGQLIIDGEGKITCYDCAEEEIK
jgi:hypothetical protein